MTFLSNKEIEHIYSGIIDQTLPKSEWTHNAHFAAAVAMLNDINHMAFQKMPDVIKAYNIATGVENTDTDGYHHTITLASLMAANTVMNAASTSKKIFEITNDILASDFGKPQWILAYWTTEVLFSVTARRNWVGPDIKPLPFM